MARKGKEKAIAGDEEAPVERSDKTLTDYPGPFKIISFGERTVYEKLLKYDVLNPKSIDFHWSCILGVEDQIVTYLKALHLETYAKFRRPAYTMLTMEFFTSFRLVENREVMTCRLGGELRRIDKALMMQLFGFTNKGESKFPGKDHFNLDDAWRELSDFPRRNGDLLTAHIKDHALAIVHKFLCYAVCGKKEALKVSQDDIYFLHCALHNKPINAIDIIWSAIDKIRAGTRFHPTFGHIVTALAEHFNVETGLDMVDSLTMGLEELKASKLVIDMNTLRPHNDRKCVIDYFLKEKQLTEVAKKFKFGERPIINVPPYAPPPNPLNDVVKWLDELMVLMTDGFATLGHLVSQVDSRVTNLDARVTQLNDRVGSLDDKLSKLVDSRGGDPDPSSQPDETPMDTR